MAKLLSKKYLRIIGEEPEWLVAALATYLNNNGIKIELLGKNIKAVTIIVCLGYMLFMLWNGDLGINPYIPMWESGAY